MDDDVIVIDNRNARPPLIAAMTPKGSQTRAPVIVHQAQPPVYVQSATTAGAVYVRDPATGALVRDGGTTATAAAPVSGLRRFTTGELVDMGVQIFAVLMPLPGAPNPTGDIAKDVRNDTLYQGALALAEKRERQIRTIGNLVGKLLA